jgi:tetratricopeptide (TPR) repeat protein
MSPVILAAALSLLAFDGASAQPSAPSASSQEVVVRAPLTPHEALIKSQSFVRTYARPTEKLDQYARWEDPLCVAVSGLAAEQAALTKARVEEVAKGVGLKLGRPGCRPNIDIRFADPPQALLDQVAAKSPWLLGFHYPNGLEALKTVTRPVQAWYMTASRGEGAGNVALSTLTQSYLDLKDPNGGPAGTSMTSDSGLPESIRPNESLDGPGSNTPNGCAGRRFSSCLASVFWHVLIVVDSRRVQGQPLGPIMDYLAMLAISQPRSLDGCLELPSVIDLFAPTPCPGWPSPSGLTPADSAYLDALYKADLGGKKAVELSDIADRMAKSLANGPIKPKASADQFGSVATDASTTSPRGPATPPIARDMDIQRRCFTDQNAITHGVSADAARSELESMVAGCTAFITARHSSGDIGLALQARAAAHLKLGESDQAVADYTAALKPAAHDPRQTARILQDRALTYEQLGRNDLAIADLIAALKVLPKGQKAAELMFALAIAYDRSQQLQQEIETYSAMLKLDPLDRRAWVGRAYAEDLKGDRAAAEADARRSLDLDPDLALAHKLMAELLIADGRAKEAYADAEAAVKADPNDALARKFRADAALAEGELDEAIADYDRVIAMDPKLVSAFNNRGAAYLGKGDFKAAMDDFNTVIGMDAGQSSAWLNRGLARQALGDPAGALADFVQAVALDPTNAAAWRHRAFLEQSAGRHAQAADDYGRAIALNPKDEEALRGRGFAEISLERYDAAIADLTAAIAIDPKDGKAYDFRAMAYAGAGKTAQAFADNEKAKRLADSAARR